MKIIGKSGNLLNTCLWAKKYNKDIKTNDPTKKPCILYVTQENSIDETLERIWSYYFGDDLDIKNYNPIEALRMLEEAGFNDEGITIKIKYRPNKSINTSDLDSIIDDLSLEGYEVILLVHDYIKRLKSISKYPDMRLELGSISDELTVIAKLRNIPVVTASQFNREAFKIAEAALGKTSNLAKKLGSSQTGESMLMIENFDYVIIQAIEERLSTNKKYLTVKLSESRGKNVYEKAYFAHPFKSGMRLEEDFGLTKSLSIDDLGDELTNFDSNTVGEEKVQRQPKAVRTRKIKEVQTKTDLNIFD